MRCHDYRCHSGILRQGVASQMERRRIGILCRNHAGSFHVGTDSASLRTDQSLVAGSNRRDGRRPVSECARSGNSPSSSHHGTRPRGASQQCQAQSCDAFVMAIALHKLPEGMAAGVSVCSAEGATEWGYPSASPCRTSLRVWWLSLLWWWLVLQQSAPFYFHFHRPARSGRYSGGFRFGFSLFHLPPRDVGFAGGAMLYVTSDEMIPETHAHGFQKQATYALLLGFITFVLMEKCV